MARTSKVCEPSGRPVYCFTDVQGTKPDPSRLHSNVSAVSLPPNWKLADEPLVEGAKIVVSGGTLSMSTTRPLPDPLPDASTASMKTVYRSSGTSALFQLYE